MPIGKLRPSVRTRERSCDRSPLIETPAKRENQGAAAVIRLKIDAQFIVRHDGRLPIRSAVPVRLEFTIKLFRKPRRIVVPARDVVPKQMDAADPAIERKNSGADAIDWEAVGG